jgi:site-specific DNA recombinase
MRAAIYIRVSTEEQAIDGYSLAAQERLCRAYATSHGWEVMEIYADEGISGRSANRPALQRLRAEVASGRIEAVIVHKLDRLARNLRLTIEIIEELGKSKVSFVSVAEQLDLTTPMGWAMFQVQGVFAEFYSRNLSVETAKGKREKAQQGGWVGPIPIGYRKDEQGELVPSDDAVIVQTIFERYATRQHSYTSIADELNAQGYQTNDWQTGKRGHFGRESIRTILGNYAYLGYVSAGGTRYKGRHAALVSTELFQLVQDLRAERSHEHGTPVRTSDAWLLGLVFCTECGGKYWHQFGNRNTSGRYYRCSGVSRRECHSRMVRAEVIEGQVIEVLQHLALPEHAIPLVIAEAQRLAQRETSAKPVDDTRAITDRLQQLKDAYNADILTKAEYEKKSKALLNPRPTPVPIPFSVQHAIERLQQIPTLVEQTLPFERMALVKSLFEKIWVTDRSIIRLTPRADVGEIIASVARVWDGVPDGLDALIVESIAPNMFAFLVRDHAA